MIVPGLLLAVVVGLLSERIQARLRLWVHGCRLLILAAPLGLTGIFAAAASNAGAGSLPLTALVLVYTLAPTVVVLWPGGTPGIARWADIAAILLLWLPLEFAAGASLVPKPVQGYLHAVAYGVAIVLALWLFLIFRALKGTKYNLPRSTRDLLNPLAGFAVLLPVLAILGLLLGFLAPPHVPHVAWTRIPLRYLIIFCATALPEEILFRGLIQNWLMQKFGPGNRTLLAAGFIFGCSHLNNGPLPLPNWRYMILATLAGIVFGRVFQKSSSILSSASLHAAVDTTKYAFF
jgi:membrane protease YdiL (CAAX protease family)